jgi:hypothetical protein
MGERQLVVLLEHIPDVRVSPGSIKHNADNSSGFSGLLETYQIELVWPLIRLSNERLDRKDACDEETQ